MHLKVDIVGDMPKHYNPNFNVSLYLLNLSIFSSFLSFIPMLHLTETSARRFYKYAAS